MTTTRRKKTRTKAKANTPPAKVGRPPVRASDPNARLRVEPKREQKKIIRRMGEYSAKAFAGQIIGYFETMFMDDLMRLKPKERIDAMIRLSRYVYPVLNANVSLRINSRESNERRNELMQLASAFGRNPEEVLPEEVLQEDTAEEVMEEPMEESDVMEEEMPFEE